MSEPKGRGEGRGGGEASLPPTDPPVDANDITQEMDIKGGADPREQGALRLIRGPEVGAFTAIPHTGSLVVGRGGDVDLSISDRGLSRRHARFFHLAGSHYVEDLGSTNGVFVEGSQVGDLPLRLSQGDRIALGESIILMFELHDELSKQASETIYRKAVRDALTGLHNRSVLDERIRQETAFTRRHRVPLSVIMIDLDHFKRVNDDHGHAAGDAVLRAIARVLSEAVRAEDLVARYGGEELCVLARGTDTGGAMTLAERLRRHIESLPIRANFTQLRVTASLGVATYRGDDDDDVVARADAALYEAKRAGRNRCVHADVV
ncbi:MAG: GGDEF domain-containing protein [Sandaracinus sp.]|nr:GGDEF domain-containing protein [Sandaracinus sp.]|tara:strand:+ start:2472 stop:3434 length:963 start_codon:yes stop_codon:yes gene_type:complete